MKCVYLSGPIWRVSALQANMWREAVQREWPNCLNPLRHNQPASPLLIAQDKLDIEQCDVFFLWHPKPSWGSAMETMYAYERGKPIVVVNATRRALNPWLQHHATHVVLSLDAALQHLRENYS